MESKETTSTTEENNTKKEVENHPLEMKSLPMLTNLAMKFTTLMVQEGPLREENMITKVDPDCHLQETMQQISKKTRQIRTETKESSQTEPLAEIITKM